MERVLSYARRYRRPVYIELPRDIVSSPLPILPLRQNDDVDFQTSISEEYKTDIASMQEALEEAARMINSSRQPVIVAGVEIHRFGLQDKILQLVGKTNIPVVSTVLSKSVKTKTTLVILGYMKEQWGFSQLSNTSNPVIA